MEIGTAGKNNMMNNEISCPVVSVIIPVYNTDQYLNECLDSAINQTLQNIEIVCINDGSTDNSLSILEEYEKKYPRVTVISQQNKGLGAARNCGIQHSKGKYVFFLDSDDYIDTSVLEKTVRLAEDNTLDAVVFNFKQFAESEELINQHPHFINTIPGTPQIYAGFEYLKTAKEYGAYSPVIWNVLWSRSFLQQNSLSFLEGIIHEDLLFSFRAFMAASAVMPIPDVLYHYRAREGAVTNNPISAKNVYGYFECIKGILEYALKKDYEPDREYILRRTYAEMTHFTYTLYSILSPEERAGLNFQREIENDLFRQIIDFYQIDSLRAQFNGLQAEAGRLRDELAEQQNQLAVLNNENEKALSSPAYRLGRTVTWLPRRIRGGIICYQQHGFLHTVKRCFEHLTFRA